MKILSSFWLKMIAITAMTIDHVGMIFFPQYIFLRIIGRLAFPIMAFALTEGYRHTKNHVNYMIRLLIFAVLSAIPFYLLFGTIGDVYFTLFLSLLALYCYEKANNNIWVVLLISMLAIPFDWSIFGVWVTFVFYKARQDTLKMLLWISAMLILFYAGLWIYGLWGNGFGLLKSHLFQVGVLLSLFLIQMYNGKRGPNLQYVFYIYYPFHLLVLYFLIN